MKITINGSPKELAELVKALSVGVIAAEKKVDIPPLLTELSDVKETIEHNHKIITSLKKMHEVTKQGKENTPQTGAAEQEIPFIHFKPRFEEWIKIVKEANEVAEQGKENAPQAETAEQNNEIRYFNTTADDLKKTSRG